MRGIYNAGVRFVQRVERCSTWNMRPETEGVPKKLGCTISLMARERARAKVVMATPTAKSILRESEVGFCEGADWAER